jgi:hypothetical protein
MVMMPKERFPRDVQWAGAWGAQGCQGAMRVPTLNRLLLPGFSGDFSPILYQYTSAIRPDDEARAIHWITSYAYYALCAPHEAIGCLLSPPTLGYP